MYDLLDSLNVWQVLFLVSVYRSMSFSQIFSQCVITSMCYNLLNPPSVDGHLYHFKYCQFLNTASNTAILHRHFCVLLCFGRTDYCQ